MPPKDEKCFACHDQVETAEFFWGFMPSEDKDVWFCSRTCLRRFLLGLRQTEVLRLQQDLGYQPTKRT